MRKIFPRFYQILGPRFTALCIRAYRHVFSSGFCSRWFLPSLLRVRTRNAFQAPVRYFSCGVGFDLSVNLELNDYSQISAFFGGLPPICLTFLEHASDRSAFIDVGANLGLVSAAVAQRLPSTSIYAIEANPMTSSRLREQFATNCPGATVVNVGFSSSSGSLPMKLVPHDSGSCSLDPKRFSGKTSWHNVDFEPQVIQIPVVKFDDWFVETNLGDGKYDRFLIKIDVEGHEFQVLKGMGRFLASSHPALIICEVANENLFQVRQTFSIAGFQERRPCWNPQLAEQPHHTDLVFSRGL